MKIRRWPLFLIAAPAAVAVWSGWVGLGGMCGFGVIHPLPGIWDSVKVNTAITLPIGVEAYGAYAMGAWLRLPPGHPARKFAKRSAIGSLLLGMLGQVAFHLLNAAHAIRAPWPIVALVSCLPVVVLGFGAGLTHLLGQGGEDEADEVSDEPQLPLEALSAASRPSMSTFSTATAEADQEPASEDVKEPARAGGSHAAPKARTWSRQRRVAAIVANNPNIKGAELGRKLGVHPRTGQRELNKLRASMGDI